MQSCKRQFPFAENGACPTDYRLQLNSAKRHCKDKSCSPSKFAVQMETREVTEMDCEPFIQIQDNTPEASSHQQQVIHYPQQSFGEVDASRSNSIMQTPNINNSRTMNSYNNNNTIVDKYITPTEICVRCQAGEAGHYGHIGR